MARTAHIGRTGRLAALATALAVGQTVRQAAQTAGIGERTAYYRAASPALQARVQEEREALMDRARGCLVDSLVSAALTLRSISEDADQPAHVRIQAAGKLLDFGLRGQDSAGGGGPRVTIQLPDNGRTYAAAVRALPAPIPAVSEPQA